MNFPFNCTYLASVCSSQVILSKIERNFRVKVEFPRVYPQGTHTVIRNSISGEKAERRKAVRENAVIATGMWGKGSLCNCWLSLSKGSESKRVIRFLGRSLLGTAFDGFSPFVRLISKSFSESHSNRLRNLSHDNGLGWNASHRRLFYSLNSKKSACKHFARSTWRRKQKNFFFEVIGEGKTFSLRMKWPVASTFRASSVFSCSSSFIRDFPDVDENAEKKLFPKQKRKTLKT